jgi:hypothetical protein
MIPKKKESKEKAKELVDKFYQRFPLTMDVITTRGDLSWEYDSWKEAKQCALIAVNYIITSNPHSNPFNTDVYSTMDYWQEVEQELLIL